jgi:hypothetical protein
MEHLKLLFCRTGFARDAVYQAVFVVNADPPQARPTGSVQQSKL